MVKPLATLTLLAAFALVAGGPSRPPWADGAEIQEAWPTDARPQDLADWPRRVLALHNRARASAGAAPLVWDERLASAAAAYGTALAQIGRLAHSEPETRPEQGENLWMGTRGAYSIEEMIESWAEERRLFRPGTFSDVSVSGYWGDVGHYTQMIWHTTSRVGCALHRTRDWDFLICRYAPAGNVEGERVP